MVSSVCISLSLSLSFFPPFFPCRSAKTVVVMRTSNRYDLIFYGSIVTCSDVVLPIYIERKQLRKYCAELFVHWGRGGGLRMTLFHVHRSMRNAISSIAVRVALW